jgi:hypothetical protein
MRVASQNLLVVAAILTGRSAGIAAPTPASSDTPASAALAAPATATPVAGTSTTAAAATAAPAAAAPTLPAAPAPVAPAPVSPAPAAAAVAPAAASTTAAAPTEPAAPGAAALSRSAGAAVATPLPSDEAPVGGEARCSPWRGQSICSITYDPSELDPEVESIDTSVGGHGVHFACYPREVARWNGKLLLHFVGTVDNPGRTHAFAELACALGFAAVVPMYKNVNSSRSVCRTVTGCYEAMRREVLYGGDSAPDPIRVDRANSALHRLDTVLRRLATVETRFPAWGGIRERVTARDLSDVTLSGHSQGSGHALMLARDHEVERVVLLAGPPDRLASGRPEQAPVQWIVEWRSLTKTPAERVLAYLHEEDAIAYYREVLSNYDLLGVGASECAFTDSGALPAECRRVRGVAAGCRSLDAHLAPTQLQFGADHDRCRLSGERHDNRAVWQFLLTSAL